VVLAGVHLSLHPTHPGPVLADHNEQVAAIEVSLLEVIDQLHVR
jgi:hypothetical protein